MVLSVKYIIITIFTTLIFSGCSSLFDTTFTCNYYQDLNNNGYLEQEEYIGRKQIFSISEPITIVNYPKSLFMKGKGGSSTVWLYITDLSGVVHATKSWNVQTDGPWVYRTLINKKLPSGNYVGKFYLAYKVLFTKQTKIIGEVSFTVSDIIIQNLSEEIYDFLKEISPSLLKRVNKIENEIIFAGKTISNLSELKKQFPTQNSYIHESYDKWYKIKKDLCASYNNIASQLERAYISYKINDLQGKNTFEAIQEDLLKSADNALNSANILKKTIEEVAPK